MSISNYFPIWNKLTKQQQDKITEVSVFRKVSGGTRLHEGGPNCLGMLLVRKGQLRAYMLSEEGREVTISRFLEMDICLFSASCVMPNMQFDIFIEAEKDSELWIIPACLMWLMEQIMWKSFDKRLAQFLCEESALEASDSLKITHEKIANHMGTAREVVTRMLRYFQNEGMVRLTRGSVDLTDIKKLQALSDA